MKSELKDITINFKRIVGVLEKKYCWRLAFALALMVIVGGLANVPAVALGKLLDRFIKANAFLFSESLPYLSVIFISILVREGVQIIRKYLVEDTCTRVEKATIVNLVDHLLKLDFNFFSNQKIGALHGRINRSIEGYIKLIKLSFLDFLPSLFVAFFALGVVLVKAPILGMVMALVIPIGMWIVFHQVASQKGIRINLLRGKDKIDGTLVELLGGIENVRTMNSEAFETARIEKVAERLREKEIIHHLYMAGYDAAKYINEGVFHVVVLALAIWLASRQIISTGEILTYSMLFISVTTPLREIHRILDEGHESSIRATDLFDLMDLPLDKAFNQAGTLIPTAGPFELKKDAGIEISNLHFIYPDTNISVLNDVSLNIKSGEFIGIVGSTGCGKSTLLKVLLRLNHPQAGKIRLFGNDLDRITMENNARLCCYISQNPFVISGSVYDNIVYGLQSNDFSRADVEAAAQKACVHDDIINFQDGYDTEVGERGCKLAGGQRQRIAIARIFLRRPDLLILDEATSALDVKIEAKVQSDIEALMKNGTIIAVAHRTSTLRNTDRLIVMENGKIVQIGTYAELTGKEKLSRETKFSNQNRVVGLLEAI